MRNAFILARLRAGNNSAARMAMMAITTSNSMRVKATRARPEAEAGLGVGRRWGSDGTRIRVSERFMISSFLRP
jgi:hypothetical protein